MRARWCTQTACASEWTERVRKVSHCSKPEGGADAFSAFTSVIRTLTRKGGGQSMVDGLYGVFSGAPVHARST